MRAKLIQFTDGEGDRIEILCATEEGRPWPATEAELLAAGYVPASQLAEVTAQLEAAEERVRELEAKFIHLGSVYGWTEAAKPAEPYECNCPAPHKDAVHDLTCPEHLKRFPEDKPASPPSPPFIEVFRAELIAALRSSLDYSPEVGWAPNGSLNRLADELERAQKGNTR